MISRIACALAKNVHQPSQIELGTVRQILVFIKITWQHKSLYTVFFFARSPDAPSTTITVFSLSSMVLTVREVELARETDDSCRLDVLTTLMVADQKTRNGKLFVLELASIDLS